MSDIETNYKFRLQIPSFVQLKILKNAQVQNKIFFVSHKQNHKLTDAFHVHFSENRIPLSFG